MYACIKFKETEPYSIITSTAPRKQNVSTTEVFCYKFSDKVHLPHPPYRCIWTEGEGVVACVVTHLSPRRSRSRTDSPPH